VNRFDAAMRERLRAVVAERLGLEVEEAKLDVLAAAAAHVVSAVPGRSAEDWLEELEGGGGARGDLGALAERLTVGETYFFRNEGDLAAFREEVLPRRLAARAGERRLRVLSAGCSSGEEPYTLAMILSDLPELAGWDWSVRAFDVNPAALARARAGRYGDWALRQTAVELRERFFVRDGRHHAVRDEVRARVTFEEGNLAAEPPGPWAAGPYDVVFCRNVIMYLTPETKRRAVARLAAALAPEGALFLGHAETLRGVSTAFHLRQGRSSFYYERREGDDEGPAPAATGFAPALPPPPSRPVAWFEAIRAASDRVAELTRAPAPGAPAAVPAGAPPAPPLRAGAPASVAGGRRRADGPGGFALALELLRAERFAEALEALGPGAPGGEDQDALLLRAALLVSAGDGAGAERVCARILERDELHAEAHYVRALCRALQGDLAGAADHDRYAAYLDPGFAMPRLHLGLLARRAGDAATAKRELARALVLLGGEAPARVLLLGGGFAREALIALCRAELDAAREALRGRR
jgi:chemotaxis protein methyltransferase CheR